MYQLSHATKDVLAVVLTVAIATLCTTIEFVISYRNEDQTEGF